MGYNEGPRPRPAAASTHDNHPEPMTTKKNLWILTQERFSKSALIGALQHFARTEGLALAVDVKRWALFPTSTDELHFSFTYEIEGVRLEGVERLFVQPMETVPGGIGTILYRSTVQPDRTSVPAAAYEYAGSNDTEHAQLLVRLAKMAAFASEYPEAPKPALLLVEPKETVYFGRTLPPSFRLALSLMKTLGIDFEGFDHVRYPEKPFESLDELIERTNEWMPQRSTLQGRKLRIERLPGNTLRFNGWIEKGGNPSAEPATSLVTVLAWVVRHLGFNGTIVLAEHGLIEGSSYGTERFRTLMASLGVLLDGMTREAYEEAFIRSVPPRSQWAPYWIRATEQRRQVIYFLEALFNAVGVGRTLLSPESTLGRPFMWREDGYAIEVEPVFVRDRQFTIPDWVVLDEKTKTAVLWSARTWRNRWSALEHTANFDLFTDSYMTPYYPDAKVEVYGAIQGTQTVELPYSLFAFMLTNDGTLIPGEAPPPILTRALSRLKDAWRRKNRGYIDPALLCYDVTTAPLTLF